jgi:hypothetical protein
MKDVPRLRRRPTASTRPSIAWLWRHRACRVGFVVGFAVGVVAVAGLAGRVTHRDAGAREEVFSNRVKTATVVP